MAKQDLTLLKELLVLGGRYMFGRGQTASGRPMLYVSIPGRGGVSVLEENLEAFRDALNEAIEKFPNAKPVKKTKKAKKTTSKKKKTRTKVDPAKEEPEEEETDVEDSTPCPGPEDESWLYINEVGGALAEMPILFDPHDFQPQKHKESSCDVCTYDTEVDYSEEEERVRLEHEGDPDAKPEPREERSGGVLPGKSARFP